MPALPATPSASPAASVLPARRSSLLPQPAPAPAPLPRSPPAPPLPPFAAARSFPSALSPASAVLSGPAFHSGSAAVPPTPQTVTAPCTLAASPSDTPAAPFHLPSCLLQAPHSQSGACCGLLLCSPPPLLP